MSTKPEPSSDDEPHLRSASVSFDGNLIVVGTMVHEPDGYGHFPMFDTTHLQLSPEHFRIVRCKAVRTESGFQKTEEIGAALNVPLLLQMIIKDAFRFGTAGKKEASLDFQVGELRSPISAHPPVQKLSHWHLSVEERGKAIWVSLSANLLSIEDDILTHERKNYWSHKPSLRIAIDFVLDPVTRMACYGSYLWEFPNEQKASPAAAYRSTLTTLSLGNAPIGLTTDCGSFGKDWVTFYEGGAFGPQISFTRIRPPKRDKAGFLVDCYGYLWPRVSFEGVSTKRIVVELANKPSVRLVLSGDITGHIEGHHTEEPPTEYIAEAVLNVTLGLSGLEFDFQVKTKSQNPHYREIFGSCLLCWEVLILRYPAFLRHRARIISEANA